MESIVAIHSLEFITCAWTREGRGRECPGSDRPLYPVCPGICHSISDGPDNYQGLMRQFHHPLWVARENPFGPGKEL